MMQNVATSIFINLNLITMIKVNNTRLENGVLVTDAKVVLVECTPEEALIGYSDYSKYDLINKWLSIPEKYFKPILISETEIEGVIGDSIFFDTKFFKHITTITKDSNVWHKTLTTFKILALPEHFSEEALQQIVDGKLKDGDKVTIECDRVRKRGYKCKDCGLRVTLGRKCKDESHKDLIFDDAEFNRIKLNQSNHIIIHKSEEKMYTREEVKKLFDQFSNSEELAYIMDGYYSGCQYAVVIEWFDKNIK